jgi:RNA polymerase sigma factor (sigma-70 family)
MDHPPEGLPDDALRSRVRDGDADAFGELFGSFASHVYSHAFRLTGDRSAAEDVLSLTFLEAWRNREQISPEGGSLRPWLLGVATNVLRGHYRARRRHQEILARLGLQLDVEDFAEDLSGRMDDAARVAAMHRSLARLRGPERDVLALCVWSGLSYAEAAEALGIPVGTVRSRLARARGRLADLAEKELRAANRELPLIDGRLRGASAPAAVTLEAMAMRSAAAPPPAIGPHQWYYVKTEYKDIIWVMASRHWSHWSYATGVSCFPDNPWPITAQSVQVQESWRGQKISMGFITKNGGGGAVGGGRAGPGFAAAAKPGIMNPAYSWLQSLPADPYQLLKILYAQSAYLGGDRNVSAFSAIGRLLSSTVLPPAAEAAIYWTAALIPGVTLIPETTDMTGRAGFGIALADSGGLQNEWIFSKDTYTFLGTRATQVTNAPGFVATSGEVGAKVGTWFPGPEPGTWVVEPGTFVPGPKAGTLLAETAIVARGTANALGGKPTLFP